MLRIKDSVAVITGGASGIGLSMAKYWAANGGKVVLGDIAEEPLAGSLIPRRLPPWSVKCFETKRLPGMCFSFMGG